MEDHELLPDDGDELQESQGAGGHHGDEVKFYARLPIGLLAETPALSRNCAIYGCLDKLGRAVIIVIHVREVRDDKGEEGSSQDREEDKVVPFSEAEDIERTRPNGRILSLRNHCHSDAGRRLRSTEEARRSKG